MRLPVVNVFPYGKGGELARKGNPLHGGNPWNEDEPTAGAFRYTFLVRERTRGHSRLEKRIKRKLAGR